MNLTSFGLVLTGVLLNAAAQLFLKAGTTRVGSFDFSAENIIPIGLKLAAQWPISAGLGCYAISVVVWIMALSRVPVSIAYPMLSIGYIINAIAAYYLFDESVNAQKIIGIGFICLGVYLVARSAPTIGAI